MQNLIVLQTQHKIQKNITNDHYIIENIPSDVVADVIEKILDEAFECVEDGN